jgi:hypothetical protein
MIGALVEPTISWLAATSNAPNVVVFVLALTSPWKWAASLAAVPERVGAWVRGSQKSEQSGGE